MSDGRQSTRVDAREPSSSTSATASGSSSLYRAPTWLKGINFDSFDLNSQPSQSPETSGYASPSDGLTGMALGGSPQLSDHQALTPSRFRDQEEPTYLQTNRGGSPAGISQPRHSNPQTRQISNTPITASRISSNTTTPSDRSTPKGPMRANMSSMLPSHQRVASASSATGSTDWLRSPMPPQLHSSADLYAAVDSRPGTSLSTISGHFDDARDDRLDSTTSNGLHKRASVLSFKTARSDVHDYDEMQNFTSAPASEMEFLDRTLPPKPWLMQPSDAGPSGSSSFNSSIDERHLPPGGWANSRPWISGAEEIASARGPSSIPNSPRTKSRNISSERQKSPSLSPSLSPRMRLTSLNDNTSPTQASSRSRTTSGSPSLSLSAQEQKSARPTSMLRNDTTEELLSAQSLGFASGPSTVDLPVQQRSSTATSSPEQIQSPSQFESQRRTSPNLISEQQQQPSQIDTRSTPIVNVKTEARAPAVPDKPSPPSIPPKDEVGLSSPPLSDNVIPAPLPVKAAVDVASIPTQMPANRAPVADFRRKPLVAMSKAAEDDDMTMGASNDTVQAPITRPDNHRAGVGAAAAAAATAAAAVATGAAMTPARVGPGIGAHAARNSGADQTAAPAFAALMRKPSNGSVPRVAIPATVTPAMDDRSPSPSIDTPPREPSPPPEGEVEARAEWERAQMRQMADRDKRASKSRKTTFRGQMKPLQFVTAEEQKRIGKGSPIQSKSNPDSSLEEVRGGQADTSGPSAAADVSRSTSGGSAGLNTAAATANASPGLAPVNGKSAGVMSTQQLQRQLARDQRRSVSAVNATMGQLGVGDIGGAYPVFSSPSASPNNIIGGIRQYPGLMPQRSLVPPFELQNRPDGLPSALIGPDGVRRSPNDPEVCLECMMRDEDMIDVHVLGAGLWERESDLDFAEAIRLEGEEDAKRDRTRQAEASASNGADRSTSESAGNGAGGDGESTSNSKEAAATVAVGSLSSTYPRLSKIRVKRVAKGEPLTAERLKLHTQMNPPASSHRWRTLQTFLAVQAKYIAMEQKARGVVPPAVPPKSTPKFDNAMVKTLSAEMRPSQRQRATSSALFQVEEVPLTAEEKANKEKDIVGAWEARRRNNASAPNAALSQGAVDTVAEEAGTNGASGPPVINDNSSGHNSIPRRSNVGPPAAYTRAGSYGDLRSNPTAMASKKEMMLPLSLSPNSLAPPQAAFRGPSSPTSPRGTRMRSVSSQMSLANSGSMIDMHVGLENSKEHRIAQAGFVPGTPLNSQSPSAMNRAFYGFPGDMEMEQGEDWSQYRGYDQNMGTSFGEYDDGYSGARSSPDLEKKRKKSGGLRGLFTKKSGKDTTEAGPEDDLMDSRRSYKRPDSSMELQPPPGMVGLLNRARRSTSSLLLPSGRQSTDSAMMLGGERGFSNPLMASQTSLDMGPFGSGPQPPPRKDSRMSQSPEAPKEKEKSTSRLRAFSSGNLMSKKKTQTVAIPSSTSRTSSMMQGPMPSTPANEDRDPYDRSTSASAMSMRRDPSSAMPSRDNSYGTSPGPFPSMGYREVYHDGQSPMAQMNGRQDQYHNPVQQRYDRSGGVSPDGRSIQDDGSMPRRPPRNPERENISGPSSEQDGVSRSKSPLFIPASLQKEQYFHSYDSSPKREAVAAGSRDQRVEQQRNSSFGYMGSRPTNPSSAPATTPSRTSKLLKLPFGKNKRESAAVSVATNTTKDTNSLKSRSSRGTFDDNAGYYAAQPRANGSSSNQAGLDSLRGGGNNTRPRYDSNASFEDRQFPPPRSQSALGMLDSPGQQGNNNTNFRGLFPRLRTSSRAALREVAED